MPAVLSPVVRVRGAGGAFSDGDSVGCGTAALAAEDGAVSGGGSGSSGGTTVGASDNSGSPADAAGESFVCEMFSSQSFLILTSCTYFLVRGS